MAKVVVTAPLRGEFPLAAGEFDIDAGSVFELVQRLEERSPGLAEFIETKVSVAVDGELISDWSTSLTRLSEVMLVPHIAGG
jgi:molybdopterin converting factor small subunit